MEKSSANKRIGAAFFLNFFFSIFELIGGVFTNSISIISDAVHDFGDAISIAIAWFLEKKSNKKPDKVYTYGYARFSILGALVTSLVLLIGSSVVVLNAIPRIINPESVNYDGMLIFAIVGLVVNGLGAFLTSHGEHLNEKAVSLHLLEDVLGWVAVLITSIAMKIFNLPILDPILSIAIAVFILYHAIKNLKEIFSVFLEKSPNECDFNHFKEELLEENDDVLDIHHIHTWTMSGTDVYATMHIVVEDDITQDEIIELKREIKHEALHHGINHLTLEFEYEKENCDDVECNPIIESHLHHHHHHHHH